MAAGYWQGLCFILIYVSGQNMHIIFDMQGRKGEQRAGGPEAGGPTALLSHPCGARDRHGRPQAGEREQTGHVVIVRTFGLVGW